MFRVLLVDDEYGIRLLMTQMLLLPEYETIEADSGHEALRLLTKHANFDVVISDIRMARMSGITLLDEVKRLYPTLPVIISSVHVRSDLIAEVMQKGAASFLARPFNRQQLQEAIDKATHWQSGVG